jgi:homoserine kinase type II
MNARVWSLTTPAGERFALKVHDRSLLPGLEVATHLAAQGIRSGEPLHVVEDGDEVAALLRWVPGRALSWEEGDLIGSTLARVHQALADAPPPPTVPRWPWAWLDLNALTDESVRAVADRTVEAAVELAERTPHGLLHGDPAPEAFIDDNGDVGLIDWGSVLLGPLIYDVASAVMYSDRSVARAYGEIRADELERFLAFRAVVQVWYFADRIIRDDLTGSSTADNQAGYDNGIALLRRLSVD